jgi:hypothetical protein
MAIVWQRAAWATNTVYALGARVTNASVTVAGIPLPCVYECAVAGTSALSGPGPTGISTGAPIVDGSVTWLFKGPLGGEVVNVTTDARIAALPAALQSTLLDIVDTSVAPDYFLSQTDAASLMLAAHMATLILLRGKGIPTAEDVGELSRSYATATGAPGDLNLTAYGATFYRMQLATAAGIGFTA